jgi:hypothetical protein
MFEECQDIIIILLVLVVIYLIFDKKRESFAVTSDVRQSITNAVNTKYNIDIAAMRNMGQVASKIMNNKDSLTIPATLTTMKNVNAENTKIYGQLNVTQRASLYGGMVVNNNFNVDGSINTSDLNIMGNLMIDNTKFNNLLPFNTIILWSENLENLPPGWAPCTGKKYKHNPNATHTQIKFMEDADGYLTPFIPPPPWANDATRQKLFYVVRMRTQEFGK